MSLLVDFKTGLIIFVSILFKKEFRKNKNIISPVSQRGQFNLNSVNPVKKILPEETFVNHIFKIPVGSTYEAYIGGDELI